MQLTFRDPDHISQHEAIELVLAREDMRAILTRLSDYELANIECRARAYAEAGIPLTAQFDFDSAATRAETKRRGSSP
jgi:hypothetical protein